MEESTGEWCAGLPLQRQRPFGAEERQCLEREARTLLLRAVGFVILYPLSLCFFAMAAAAPQTGEAQLVLTLICILLVMLWLPMTILIVRDAWQRSKGLRGDLRCGLVKQFAGDFHRERVSPEALQRLGRTGRFTEGAACVIETLPVSERLWRVQEQPLRAWVTSPIVKVAQTPEIAAIAAQWLEPVAQRDEGRVLQGRRELTADERAELLLCARRMWLRPLPAAIGFTLWFCEPIFVMLRHFAPRSAGDWMSAGVLALIAFSADARFIRALRLAGKMRQEAQAGSVIIVRVESITTDSGSEPASTSANHTALAAQNPSPPADRPAREILPLSRQVWTENGQPAGWRIARP